MKFPLSFLLLVFISFLSIAATTEKVPPLLATSSTETTIVYPVVKADKQQKKLNFFQRLMFKIAVRKLRTAEGVEKADRQASSALAFGMFALGTFILGLFIPYVIFAAIPTGVVAMVLGKQALVGGTTDPVKAKIGKTFGLVSLILFAALLVLVAIAVSSYNW